MKEKIGVFIILFVVCSIIFVAFTVFQEIQKNRNAVKVSTTPLGEILDVTYIQGRFGAPDGMTEIKTDSAVVSLDTNVGMVPLHAKAFSVEWSNGRKSICWEFNGKNSKNYIYDWGAR